MDTSYAMAKFGLESKDILRSRQKGCWHYMKYVFIFSSIIQFLIILGLVLFMLYGNAHVGTESRLQSLEQRFYALTREKDILHYNFTQLAKKYSALEKQYQNCSTILNAKLNATRTVVSFGRPLQPPPVDPCRNLQRDMDTLNITCTSDKLRSQNKHFQLELDFNRYKESISKTMTDLISKENKATQENEQLQRERTDFENQLKLLQTSCSQIDALFKRQIDQMNVKFDSIIKSYTGHGSISCKLFSDAVANSVESALINLRQDVNNVVFENSQLRTSEVRKTEDLKKCKQEKDATSALNSKTGTEKAAAEKQLEDKKEELNKLFTRYMKKEEELENCRKIPGRQPGYPGYTG